ncbi:hypothetical protein PGT21_020770 [Puccinia graminis f. sp. tritici]|uniref:Uncharacterized protein n=1 Tax=Puccinia graminis f. sp. tritici TaxID=56615 RepID=A0A5B0MQA0_PUCGR|nr:hypothetical protein PGTUg99_010452 [Puccinia graminis f. sp. tritici]KAA1084200.1 hypothetical protein PGT21_020770 [Puccinia graminis f. sp. tritici]
MAIYIASPHNQAIVRTSGRTRSSRGARCEWSDQPYQPLDYFQVHPQSYLITLRALSRYNMPRSIHHCPGTTIRKVVADLHRNMQCQVAETFDFFLVFIQPHPSFTLNS